MKKSEFTRKLNAIYGSFSDNINMILNFKTDFPESINYLRYFEHVVTANHIKNGDLTDVQIKNNQGRLKEKLHKIDQYPNIIYAMSLVYIVSSFEVLIKETTKLLLAYNTNLLAKCEKQISYSDVFKFTNYRELSNHLVDIIIYELTYKSIIEQIKYLNEKIHLGLSFKKKTGLIANRNYVDLALINEVFSTRNILLHNSGVVNKRYLELNPETVFNVGEKRKLDKVYLFNIWGAIRHSGEAIYRQGKLYSKNK